MRGLSWYIPIRPCSVMKLKDSSLLLCHVSLLIEYINDDVIRSIISNTHIEHFESSYSVVGQLNVSIHPDNDIAIATLTTTWPILMTLRLHKNKKN